jgi:hypothetical protein
MRDVVYKELSQSTDSNFVSKHAISRDEGATFNSSERSDEFKTLDDSNGRQLATFVFSLEYTKGRLKSTMSTL